MSHRTLREKTNLRSPLWHVTFAMLLLALPACAPVVQPKLHFASATKSQLDEAANKPEVWYEFKPGDTVPLHVLVTGVAEGGAKNLSLTAKKPFFIVVRQGRPTQMSFDGKSVAYYDSGQTILGLGQVDGKNALTVIGYVGKKVDMPPELVETKK